jgi:XTP/dITP diphosphohydrolase
MKTLVFATHNKHKADEITPLLGGLYEIKALDAIGISEDIPENGDTLEANARQKARYVYDRTGADVFADDTGLEVEALDGRPGVFTARYAGDECDSVKNMQKLLSELEGKDNRRARFRTVICLIDNGVEHLFEGVVNGTITTSFAGTEGFGYDPIFMPDGTGRTFAEMPLNEKNKISHRALAVEKLSEFLQRGR